MTAPLSGLPNMTSSIGAAGTAQHLCPPELLGRFQGLASATGAAGAIGGSVLVGLMITHNNIKLLLNVQAALYVACGLTTLALVIRPRWDSKALATSSIEWVLAPRGASTHSDGRNALALAGWHSQWRRGTRTLGDGWRAGG